MKQRILIVDNSIAVTGALKSAIRSSQSMRNDYDFVFLLPTGSAAATFVREEGFEVVHLRMAEIQKSFRSLVMYLPFLFYNTFQIRRVIKVFNINLIVNNDFYNLIPPLYKLFGGTVPYVSYVRFLPARFPKVLIALWYRSHTRFSKYVLAVSNAVARQLTSHPKLIVIPNELPQMNVEYHWSPSKTFLYVGNYIQGKGQDHAIESFAKASAALPGWTMKFIGGDMGLEKNKRYRYSLMQRAKELGIDDRIDWGGFQSDVSKAYLEAGVILNFSDSESFSLTCLEALYYGRPLIATRCGGPEEIVENGYSGLLVDVADTEAMSQQLQFLAQHPDERKRLSRNGFQSVRERFNYENTIGKLNTVYQLALNAINKS